MHETKPIFYKQNRFYYSTIPTLDSTVQQTLDCFDRHLLLMQDVRICYVLERNARAVNTIDHAIACDVSWVLTKCLSLKKLTLHLLTACGAVNTEDCIMFGALTAAELMKMVQTVNNPASKPRYLGIVTACKDHML